MSYQEVSLNPKLLLAAINTNLNSHFFASKRPAAKQLYHEIADGKDAPFMRIDTGEAGEVLCELALDSSMYVGKLNFGRFRKSLATMMLAITDRIDAEEKLNALSSQQGEIMFNVPGFVNEDEQLNVMVCSFKSLGPGMATVRLMYLDPEQYVAAAQAKDAQAKDKSRG